MRARRCRRRQRSWNWILIWLAVRREADDRVAAWRSRSMNDGCFQGSSIPRACAAAMTSVAASSTTLKPSSSSWRRMAVLPEPGAPVRMNLLIAVRLANADLAFDGFNELLES